jgi:hypothetical protein
MSEFVLPVVGADTDNWGAILNETLDNLNDRVDEHTAEISGKASLDGAEFTDRIYVKTESMLRVDLGSVSGDVEIDLDAGNYFMIEPSGAVNLQVVNIPAGSIATGFVIRIINPGLFALTFEGGDIRFKWPGGIVPSFTVSGIDTLVFITDNNGDSIRASRLFADSRAAGT